MTTPYTKTVIVTGFQPFADHIWNPSADIAEKYNKQKIGACQVIGLVLPCTYYGAFTMLSEHIDIEKPDAIISLGLATSVQKIRIETNFRNIMNGKYPDNEGYTPDNIPIKKGCPEFVSATAHNTGLANMLAEKNIPVELSGDANGFICNSLAYLTVKKIQRDELTTRNMFIHIPWTNNYAEKVTLESGKTFLDIGLLYTAIEILIKNI